MSILIVETRASGHLLVYVRLLVEAAVDMGYRVTVAVPQSVRDSPEYRLHLEPVSGIFTWMTYLGQKPTLAGLRRLAGQIGAQATVVPDADVLAPKVSLSRGWKSSGVLTLLIMRDPRWEPLTPWRRVPKRLAKLALLSLAERMKSVRVVWLRQPGYLTRRRELYACDPVIIDEELDTVLTKASLLRQQLAMPSDRFWYGIAGAISLRKNPDMVARALLRLKARDPKANVGLAFIGPMSPEVASRIESLSANLADSDISLVRRNSVMTNAEMNVAIAALDCVVMAYSSHAPNSTLGKAAALGTRLVGAGSPSIQHFVESVSSGFISDLNEPALSVALAAAGRAPKPEPVPGMDTTQFCQSLLQLK